MPVWGKSWIILLKRGWAMGRSRGEMSDLGIILGKIRLANYF